MVDRLEVPQMVTQTGAFCYHRFGFVDAPITSPIVVGYDGSPGGRRAASWAGAVAAGRPGCEIHLVQALALPPVLPHSWERTAEEILADAERQARGDLAAASAALAATGVPVRIHLRRWLPVDTLLEAARDLDARLLVVGQHGHRATRLLLGSTSGAVSRVADIPVVVVRGAERRRPPERVLLAIDGSTASRRAALAAAAWFPRAEFVGASFRSGSEGLDDAALGELLRALLPANARIRRTSAAGDAAEGLLALIADESIDLVAAGRRGHGLLAELLLGSVSEKLLQLSDCPILLAH